MNYTKCNYKAPVIGEPLTTTPAIATETKLNPEFAGYKKSANFSTCHEHTFTAFPVKGVYGRCVYANEAKFGVDVYTTCNP